MCVGESVEDTCRARSRGCRPAGVSVDSVWFFSGFGSSLLWRCVCGG